MVYKSFVDDFKVTTNIYEVVKLIDPYYFYAKFYGENNGRLLFFSASEVYKTKEEAIVSQILRYKNIISMLERSM